MLDADKLIDEFHSYIERAVAPLNARIKELEARLQEKPDHAALIESAVSAYMKANPPAAPASAEDVAAEIAESGVILAAVSKHLSDNPPQPGKDGLNATHEQIASSVESYLKANPPKDGKDASASEVADALIKSDALAPLLDLYATDAVAKHFADNPVRHGKDGLNASAEQVADAVAAYVKANPPKDGESVTVDDISVFMDAALAKWALEFERRANDTLTKAIEKIPEPKNGRDGVAMPTLEYDGKRTITVKAATGEVLQVNKLDVPIHTGYWKEGMACDKSDIVTHDGNAWRALKDNPKTEPRHENNEDWILFARKGRDGRDHKDAKPPEPIKL